MIIVIADDFTGAAEIGGIGIRFGLNVEIQTDTIIPDNVDLLIIATDSRSKTEDEAYEEVFRITDKLYRNNYELIYGWFHKLLFPRDHKPFDASISSLANNNF